MTGDIERVLASLTSAGARYLVVGGVAAVLHGRLRTTVDLDVVVALDEANALKAIRALESLGYRPRAPVPAAWFADADKRKSWVEDKGLTVFSMWSSELPLLEVDLFVAEPFDFDSVWARRSSFELTTTVVDVVCLDDLIEMKRSAGRPQDVADVEALEELKSANDG